MKLDDLMKKYRVTVHSLNEQQKAELEQEIWAAYLATPGRPVIKGGRGDPASPSRDVFFKERMDLGRGETTNRHYLLNSLPETQPIWDRLNDRKMLLETSANILRVAKRIVVADGVELSTAVRVALEEYDSRPYLSFVGGVPVRRGIPRRKLTKEERKAEKQRVRMSSKTSEGLLLARLRNEINTYLEERTTKIEPILREKLLSDFEVSVRVVVEELRHKMASLTETVDAIVKADQVIARRRVIAACETLHMDPPAPGKPVELLKAKKQKKALAREYHPDVHAVELKDTMAEKLHSVLTAYDIIEKYNEQLSPTGKGDVSDGARAEGGGRRG